MEDKHIVVFDGTSAYVIPEDALEKEKKENNVKVLKNFSDFDEASDYCDKENENILSSLMKG